MFLLDRQVIDESVGEGDGDDDESGYLQVTNVTKLFLSVIYGFF
jgi:hypothetical protein